ncbi:MULTISPECIES: ABC transporter permease subunit [unclassified Clostridium]|uniref:ABC transporter permease n=1 Tax=unclassified Clostridium TaxID=2614128 RepID=UPI00029732B7|nr:MULTISPECIES: ABC transporter permease subunit [unclassified Clostridium]EKQ51514.1 MAG: ABC-type nitrate/sulfonate/bicarbonate transport system, permease component [Clostridium sp. Maddingley MBC34-26]
MKKNTHVFLKFKDKLIEISGLIILIILWEFIARSKIINSEVFPSFTATIKEMSYLWVNEDLYMHIMSTLWRFTFGLLSSVLIGVTAGAILSKYNDIYLMFEPLIRIFAKVNPFSLIPVFIAFFGTGEMVRLAAIIWVGVFPILLGTVQGIKQIDKDLIKYVQSMDVSLLDLILKVYIQASAHSIFAGIRISVQMTFFVIIVGEMMGVNSGLGYLLHNGAHHYFDAPKVYASCIIIITLGVVINRFFRYMQNGIFFWEEPISLFKNHKTYKKIDNFIFIILAIVLVGILILGEGQLKWATYKAEHPIEFFKE